MWKNIEQVCFLEEMVKRKAVVAIEFLREAKPAHTGRMFARDEETFGSECHGLIVGMRA
jgi:hypothetical protein